MRGKETRTQSSEPSLRNAKSTMNLIDKDPFYKLTVLKMREVLELTGDNVMFNLRPVLISFFSIYIFHNVFNQKYDYVRISKFGDVEFMILIFFHFVWNMLLILLEKFKFYKIQNKVSKILTIIVHILSTMFLLGWILSPGVNFSLKIELVTITFIFWNYVGFGIVAIIFPIPRRIKNNFCILFGTVICSFIWTMFTMNHIFILTLYLAILDIVSYILAPTFMTKDYYKRGMYISHFVKKVKNSKSHLSSHQSEPTILEDKRSKKESNIDFVDVKPNLKPNASLAVIEENRPLSAAKSDGNLTLNKTKSLSKKHTKDVNKSNTTISTSNMPCFKLRMRTQTADNLSELEIDLGMPLDKEYGPSALTVLKINSEKVRIEGCHISIETLVFNLMTLMSTSVTVSYVSCFTTLNILGIFALFQTTTTIFEARWVPVKLVTFLACLYISKTVEILVVPCFKHIGFAPTGSMKFLHHSFN